MKHVLACIAACLLFAAPALADDSAAIYAKSCKGCHGADGSKVIMGMTKPINAMSLEQVKAALDGYKSGTYGGDKKVIMERTVKPLSQEQLDGLAAYVEGL